MPPTLGLAFSRCYVKFPHVGNGLRGEGLVELNEVHVLDRQPRLSQALGHNRPDIVTRNYPEKGTA